MSRITACLSHCRAQGRKALIPYVTAGDPYADVTPALMQALVRGGADIIELGVPFSDPMADGPAIQRAAARALSRGIGLPEVLAAVEAFRATDPTTPVVLMGYLNPIERYDQRRSPGAFARAAKLAGVDGVLTVDLPPEESAAHTQQLKAEGLDPIFLLAPTSTDARMQALEAVAAGYVYYVSLRGVTGAGHLDTAAVAAMMPRIRAHTALPVGVGFGIRDAACAQAIAAVADAVVIGSRLVEVLETQTRDQVVNAAQTWLTDIRHALDQLQVSQGDHA